MLSIVFTAAVIVICAGSARFLFSRFEPEFRFELERFLFEAGIGLGLFSYLVMLAGLVQMLNRWTILAVLSVLLILSVLGFVKRKPGVDQQVKGVLQSPKSRDWIAAFCALGIVAVGAWVLVRALAPPVSDDWDSLAYHLAVPKLYLQHGGIYYIPFTSHSNFPFGVEMLYTSALAFGLIPAAKLFHYAFWIFTLLGIYSLGRTYYGVRTGVVAASLFAVMPAAIWEASTAYIDLATTFYTMLAVIALLACADSCDRRWAVFCGVAAGLAATTKMTALGAIPLLAIGAVALGWKMCREIDLKSRLGDAGFMALAALLAAAPWYIKTWIQTGNPVYPFFFEIFRGRDWNSQLAQTYRSLQMQFGVGHSPADFVMAPWNLAIFSERFYDRPGLYVGFIFLAFIPFIIIASMRDRRSAGLTVFAGGLGVIWFMLSHQSRYLLPVFAVLAVPAAYGLTSLKGLKAARYAGYTALAVSALFAFLFAAQIGSASIHVVLGNESRNDYLARTVDTYRMTEYINTLPENTKVVLFNDTRGFYLDREYLWGDWAHNTVIPYKDISSAEQFARFLRSINVTHALIRGVHNLPEGHESKLIKSAIDQGYFRDVAGDESYPVVVYEVVSR